MAVEFLLVLDDPLEVLLLADDLPLLTVRFLDLEDDLFDLFRPESALSRLIDLVLLPLCRDEGDLLDFLVELESFEPDLELFLDSAESSRLTVLSLLLPLRDLLPDLSDSSRLKIEFEKISL